MAIGVNAGHTREALVTERSHPGIDMVRLDVFFTEDAGKTWRRSTLPYVTDPAVTFEPFQSTVVGDPALEFDADGTLHLSGIASHSQALGYDVFYTSSPDLGKTWTDPVVLSTGDDNDRNWINIGPDGTIYVAWQRVGSLSEVAISGDGGKTWRIQTREQVAEDCITVSEVVFFQGAPYMACSQDGGQDHQVRLYHIDQDTGDLHQIAEPAGMTCVWPKLVTYAGGLLVAGEGCAGDLFTLTTDLANYTEPRPIEELTGSVGGIMWMTDDPWGRVHVLQPGFYNVVDVTHGIGNATRHALTENTFPRHTETLAPAYGDHYWGLDVRSYGGALVWTRDDNLDWARFVAVPAGA